MVDWVKDVLGINRYDIEYDFDFKGIHHTGTFRGIGRRGMSLSSAMSVTKEANKMWGKDSHWIVKHDG